jgi:hypothetical protein
VTERGVWNSYEPGAKEQEVEMATIIKTSSVTELIPTTTTTTQLILGCSLFMH